jgi:hypothetical protein
MTFIDETAVPLVDVAKRAGLTVDEVKAEAAALNMFVGEDWRHQEALAARDAFTLLDGSARNILDHENAWRAHTLALEQWQADRETARREAFDAAYRDAVSAGFGNTVGTDKGHQAGRVALAEFGKANPEPVFSEPESRIQNWIRRVKAGTR